MTVCKFCVSKSAYPVDTRSSVLGVKEPECEAPSRTDVKNVWNYPLIFLIRLPDGTVSSSPRQITSPLFKFKSCTNVYI